MRQVGQYRLERELGRGAFGAVHVAVHVHDPDLRAAVKIVHPELAGDPTFVESLRAECRRLASLDHPGIVRFRDLFVGEDGTTAMVLELLEGEDLFARLAAGPLGADRAAEVLEAILDALAYAHGRGLLHRDVKPSNVFSCADGRVKLLDFGIARADAGRTRTDQLQGTFDYMAPERFETGGSAASDVYATGLVAWEMVTGTRACPEGDLARKVGWHLAGRIPDLRAVRPETPGWLAEAVAALTATSPENRPADGAAALALVRSLRASAARPATRPPPTVSPTRRPGKPPPPVEEVRAPVDAAAPAPSPRAVPVALGLSVAVVALIGAGLAAVGAAWLATPDPAEDELAPEPVPEAPPPIDPAVVARAEAADAWRDLEPLRGGHSPDAWYAVQAWRAAWANVDAPEHAAAETWSRDHVAWRTAHLPTPKGVIHTSAAFAYDAAFSPDGAWLAETEDDSGGRGHGVFTVSAADGKRRVRRATGNRVFAVEHAADDAVVATIGPRSGPTSVKRGVGEDAAWETLAELPGPPTFSGLAPAADGGWWVCAGALEHVGGSGRATIELGERCAALAGAPRAGAALAVGAEGGLFLVEKGATTPRKLGVAKIGDIPLAVAPDASWAVTSSPAGLDLWDLRADPPVVKEVRLRMELLSLGPSPDGLVLAVGDDLRDEARFLDPATGEELGRVSCPRGGADQPHAVRFSPDGTRFYVGGSGYGGCVYALARG